MAKHAVVGVVRGLAADLRGTAVTACAVSPGSTDTAMLAATAEVYGVDAADLAASQAAGRPLDPDEVAARGGARLHRRHRGARLGAARGRRVRRMSTPPLPSGFTVRLAPGTHVCDGGAMLVGGSGRGAAAAAPRPELLAAEGTVVARDPDSSTVARLLLDRGLADPWWPAAAADGSVDDVTVVVPVRDRPRQLARLLAALPPALPGGGRRRRLRRPRSDPRGGRRSSAPGCAARRQPRSGRRPQHRAAPRATRRSWRSSTPTWCREPGWLGTLRRHLDDPAVGGGRRPGCSAACPRADDCWLCRYEAARSSLDLGPRPGAGAAAGPGRLPPERGAAGPPVAGAAGAGFDERMQVGRGRRPGVAGARRRAGGCATSRRPPYATTTGPTLRPWLRRKAYYGTGAAPLAARHGSDVAPLVLTPWTDRADRGACSPSGAGRCRSPRWSGVGVTVSIGPQGARRATARCGPPRR